MQTETPRKTLPGELFTLLGLIAVSLSVTLFIRADFGVSAVSGVPYVLSLAFPQMSLGTWNASMQCLWLALTMLVLGKFKPGYLFSFLMAFVFGLMLDVAASLFARLPVTIPWRFGYFVLGYGCMTVGISCFFVCGTPVLPFDTVPRAFVLEKDISPRKARTWYDLINLCLLISVGLLFMGRVVAVGWVTVFNAMTLGYATGYLINWMRQRWDIRPHFPWLEKLV